MSVCAGNKKRKFSLTNRGDTAGWGAPSWTRGPQNWSTATATVKPLNSVMTMYKTLVEPPPKRFPRLLLLQSYFSEFPECYVQNKTFILDR